MGDATRTDRVAVALAGRFGRVDPVFNNAGASAPGVPFAEREEAD